MLGHGEPLRVRRGERVPMRLRNAGPTENVTLALAGHSLTVITLDGNPVSSPKSVDSLCLAPAERADVIVEMNRPGVWVLGSTDEEDRAMGLGVVVEYAGGRGAPQLSAPAEMAWDYTAFGNKSRSPRRISASNSALKNPRRARRLQSLDHQWKVMAFHESTVYYREQQALSPRHDQQ